MQSPSRGVLICLFIVGTIGFISYTTKLRLTNTSGRIWNSVIPGSFETQEECKFYPLLP